MKRRFFYSRILILIGILSVSYTFAHETHFTQGVKFYEKRSETINGLVADSYNTDRAIYHFRKALEKDSTNIEIVVYLLKAYDFKGVFTGLVTQESIAVFKKGVDLSRTYHLKYPHNSILKYWYLSHMGRWAHESGVITAVKSNAGQVMRDLCNELIEELPTYNEAGAYRILGAIHVNVPHIPFVLSWPSKEKGLKLLKKAYALCDDSFANPYELAKGLIKAGKKDKARSILQEVKNRAPRQDRLLEDKVIIHQIRELYASLN